MGELEEEADITIFSCSWGSGWCSYSEDPHTDQLWPRLLSATHEGHPRQGLHLVFQPTAHKMANQIGHLVCQLVGHLVGQLVGHLVGQLVGIFCGLVLNLFLQFLHASTFIVWSWNSSCPLCTHPHLKSGLENFPVLFACLYIHSLVLKFFLHS